MNVWNGWIDKTMRKIINETVEHFKEDGITFDEVVEIINCVFGAVFVCIRHPKMPVVHLNEGLGSFWPSPTKILRHIKKMINKYPDKVEQIAELQKVYYRVRTQKNKRKFGKVI